MKKKLSSEDKMCYCGRPFKHRGKHRKAKFDGKVGLIVGDNPFQTWSHEPCKCGRDWDHTGKHDPAPAPAPTPSVVDTQTSAILVRIVKDSNDIKKHKRELVAAFMVGLALGSAIFTFLL